MTNIVEIGSDFYLGIPEGMQKHPLYKLNLDLDRSFSTVGEFKSALLNGFDSVFPFQNENFIVEHVFKDNFSYDVINPTTFQEWFSEFRAQSLALIEMGLTLEEIVNRLSPDNENGICWEDCQISLLKDGEVLFKSEIPFHRGYFFGMHEGKLVFYGAGEYEEVVITEYLYSLQGVKVVFHED
jgi:hypothetical protein